MSSNSASDEHTLLPSPTLKQHSEDGAARAGGAIRDTPEGVVGGCSIHELRLLRGVRSHVTVAGGWRLAVKLQQCVCADDFCVL